MNPLLKIAILSLFLTPFSVLAQDMECETEEPLEERRDASSILLKSIECDNVFRVHFYLLRDSMGENGIYEELLNDGVVTSELDFINQALGVLNEGFGYSLYPDKEAEELNSGLQYAQDIQFISDGWDYIDNTDAVSGDAPTLQNLYSLASSCSAINIYMGAPSSTSVANFPSNSVLRRGVRMARQSVLSSTLCHEIGHAFTGRHLHQGVARFSATTGEFINGYHIYDIEEYEVGYEGCEVLDDGVCDTYPQPIFASDANCEFVSGNGYHRYMPLEAGVDMDTSQPENYHLFPMAWEDGDGNPYEFRQHDNFLGSGSISCKGKWTPGQSHRFNEAISNNLSLRMASCESIEDALMTDIATPSDCYLSDGLILITAPASTATISYLIEGSVEQSSTGSLQVDGLPAGNHDFMYESSDGCSYEFTLSVPFEDCASDLDNNGFVNSSDLSIFLGNWGAECCPADLNNDGFINSSDLTLFLADWGTECSGCEADINGDGSVNSSDLTLFLSDYGTSCGCCPGDLDYDGFVNSSDLSLFLADWGTECNSEGLGTFSRESKENRGIEELQRLSDNAQVSQEGMKDLEAYLSNLKRPVGNETDLSELNIFPVPANGTLNIKSDAERLELIIADAHGRTVRHLILETSVQIDIHDLAKGVYSVRDAQGRITPRQFVVSQ